MRGSAGAPAAWARRSAQWPGPAVANRARGGAGVGGAGPGAGAGDGQPRAGLAVGVVDAHASAGLALDRPDLAPGGDDAAVGLQILSEGARNRAEVDDRRLRRMQRRDSGGVRLELA